MSNPLYIPRKQRIKQNVKFGDYDANESIISPTASVFSSLIIKEKVNSLYCTTSALAWSSRTIPMMHWTASHHRWGGGHSDLVWLMGMPQETQIQTHNISKGHFGRKGTKNTICKDFPSKSRPNFLSFPANVEMHFLNCLDVRSNFVYITNTLLS